MAKNKKHKTWITILCGLIITFFKIYKKNIKKKTPEKGLV
jgi:hypothetical protein